MKSNYSIKDFPKHLFWDLNINEIDINENSTIIIERVFNRGDIEDLKKIIDLYGIETIKKRIIKAGFLDKKTLNFVSIFLNIKKDRFQCYSKIQSSRTHWNF